MLNKGFKMNKYMWKNKVFLKKKKIDLYYNLLFYSFNNLVKTLYFRFLYIISEYIYIYIYI